MFNGAYNHMSDQEFQTVSTNYPIISPKEMLWGKGMGRDIDFSAVDGL